MMPDPADNLGTPIVSLPQYDPKRSLLAVVRSIKYKLGTTNRQLHILYVGIPAAILVLGVIAWQTGLFALIDSRLLRACTAHPTTKQCELSGRGLGADSQHGSVNASSQASSRSSGQSSGISNSSGRSSSGSSQLVYGLDFLPSGMDSTEAYTLIHNAGASVVRIGASWSQIQPTSARQYNWSTLDQQVQLAEHYNVKLVLQLGDTPTWDLPPGANGDTRYVPADCQNGNTCPAAYTYVTDLITHLGPSSPVAYIIPRNEVYDTSKNWISGTADDYARYLNAVYRAVHDAGSSIKVMNGGDELIPSSFTASPMYKPGSPAAQFAQALFSNPLFCDSLDVADIHLGFSGPVWGPQVVDTTEQGLQACAGKSIPIWVTETALTSDPSVQTDAQHEAVLGTTYTQGLSSQAQYLSDTFNALAHDANVYGMNWTFLIDDPTSSDTPNSKYGGLADTHYVPKLVYSTLEGFTE